MINQNFGENINTARNAEAIDPSMNSTVVNSDPIADTAPVNAVLIPESPINATTTRVESMDEMIVHEVLGSEAATIEAPVKPIAVSMALLSHEEAEQLRTRWFEIQGKFVDEPRSAVQQADELVSDVLGKIIQMFAHEHSALESQWNQGVDVSTEDLRKTLQHYRSFFNRLVV
jgi:hypothetical protein